MSGHSRWSQIKHKKAITDKKKGQLFSKMSKLISLAARKESNPEINIELRGIIERARQINMPKENIEKAISRISDKSPRLEELYIEALGPGGVALKIKAVTDNRNRTISEIKKILSDCNSKMVPLGSIGWMFNESISISAVNINSQLYKLFDVLDDNDDVEDITSNLQE